MPGLALALALGIHPSIGGVISGLLGSVIAESLTNRKSENYEAVMNTILAGMLGFGVLIIPLLGIRIDLEAVLFGDLLTANFGDLLRTIIGISLDLFWVYEYLLPGILPFLTSHHIEHRSNDEYLFLRECTEPLLLGDV